MDKAEQLKLLKQIGKGHQQLREDRTDLAFGIPPISRNEIREELSAMDTFREEQRQNRGEALTSDE